MIRAREAILACACLGAVYAPSVYAQGPIEERGRFELAAGPLWMGRAPMTGHDATETTPTGGRSLLFATSTELAAAAGVEARIGVRVTRALQLEASSSYARPQLRTTVSSDAEGAASATITELVHQITIDGAVVLQLRRWRAGRRATPFVSAGAGYLRQLHEGNTLVAVGQTYHVGGGMKFQLRSRAKGMKGLGVRADVRALVRTKGVAFDTRAHVSPVVAASLFVRF